MLTFFRQVRLPIFLSIPPQMCWMEVSLCKTFFRGEVSKSMCLPTMTTTVKSRLSIPK